MKRTRPEERIVLTDQKHVVDELELLKRNGWVAKVEQLPSGAFLIRAKDQPGREPEDVREE